MATNAEALAQSAAQPVSPAVSESLSEPMHGGRKLDDSKSEPDKDTSAPKGGKPNQESASGGGYTWRTGAARPKSSSHHKRQKIDPARPQAKGPEFILTTDGTSRISVQLSQHVDVTVNAERNRYVYYLPNVQVAVPNDRNPLVTTHFSTPVRQVRLISTAKGARLVIDLREPVAPSHNVKEVPGGGAAILEVNLPKSAREVNAPPRNLKAASGPKIKKNRPDQR